VVELLCNQCGRSVPNLDAFGRCGSCAATPPPAPEPSDSIEDASMLFAGLLEEPDPLIGHELGGCRLLSRAGGGGMGTVYRAEQLSLGRIVAVKVIHAESAAEPKFVARLHAEARVVAGLSHPNVLQVYDVGSSEMLHYIIMEFVDGPSLGDLIFQGVFQDPARCADILRQTLLGLGHAHSRGVIHRDLKPDNILLAHGTHVKLADFGLAKLLHGQDPRLTASGMVLGTPLYMSPEAAYGKRLDPRSDLYSLAATFYHAMCGRPLFPGDTAMGILVRHINEAPRPLLEANPAVDPGVSAVLMRMLAKDPEERFSSCEDALRALDEVQGSSEGLPPAAQGPEPAAGAPVKTLVLPKLSGEEPVLVPAAPTVPVTPVRRRRRVWAALLVFLVAGAALGGTGAGRRILAALGPGLVRLMRSSASIDAPDAPASAGTGRPAAAIRAAATPSPQPAAPKDAAAPVRIEASPPRLRTQAAKPAPPVPRTPGTASTGTPAAPRPAAKPASPVPPTQAAKPAVAPTGPPAAESASPVPRTPGTASTVAPTPRPPAAEPTQPQAEQAPADPAQDLLEQFSKATDAKLQEKLAAKIEELAQKAGPEQARQIRERLTYLRLVKVRDKIRAALARDRISVSRSLLADFRKQAPRSSWTAEVRLLHDGLLVQIQEAELRYACTSFLDLVIRERWVEAAYVFPARRCRFPEKPNPKKVSKAVAKVLQLPAGFKAVSFQIQSLRMDPEGTKGWTRLSLSLQGESEPRVQSLIWTKSCGKWRLEAEPLDKGLLGLDF
jgi:hypothetical protein